MASNQACNNWEKAISILAGNLNLGRSYVITTVKLFSFQGRALHSIHRRFTDYETKLRWSLYDAHCGQVLRDGHSGNRKSRIWPLRKRPKFVHLPQPNRCQSRPTLVGRYWGYQSDLWGKCQSQTKRRWRSWNHSRICPLWSTKPYQVLQDLRC